jgi:FG-GAP-like repeat
MQNVMNKHVFAKLLIQCMLTASVTLGAVQNSKAVSFKPPLVIPTTDQPTSVAIADIDGDGKSDMVATFYGRNGGQKVAVYRNVTLDTVLAFAAPILLDTAQLPIGLAVADLDNDGKPDLVVGHSSSYQDGINSGQISIYRNTSTTGTVTFASPVVLSCNYGLQSICVADFDNDGRPEIVAATAIGITVFRNTVSPSHLNQTSFSSRLDLNAVGNWGVVAADLDGDGRTDIITYGMGNLTLFQNTLARTNGPITFSRPIDISLKLYQVFGVVAVDLDGDSKLDFAVIENSANLLSVFLNKSTPGALTASSFSSKVSQAFAGGTYAWAMAADDYDGDGRCDLACGVSESLVLYQNSGVRPFTTNSLGLIQA